MKYLDNTGLIRLWSKIKTALNSKANISDLPIVSETEPTGIKPILWINPNEEMSDPTEQISSLSSLISELNRKVIKYDTIEFTKTVNQEFTTNSYDNIVTFDTCTKNSSNSQCYLSNNRIYITNKVKKISVYWCVKTSSASSKNIRIAYCDSYKTIYSTNPAATIEKTFEIYPTSSGYIDLCIYPILTVTGSQLYSWAIANIEYVD